VIEASWIVGLGVILFSIGLLGAFTRKNAIVVLMCIGVMLNRMTPSPTIQLASITGPPPCPISD
jgi:NADH:ubiquinone oxidoreductase subunit K